MTLTLNILRYPDAGAPETRRISGGELVIGRGPGADWVLRDPAERPQISRRHCIVGYDAGAWTVTDISTNGTQLNAVKLPHRQASRALRDGDRIMLGPYEIEARVAADAPFVSSFSPGAPSPDGSGLPPPFAPSPLYSDTPMLPDDYIQQFLEPGTPATAFTQRDHTPVQTDAFQVPRPRPFLPADWEPAAIISSAREAPSAPLGPAPDPAIVSNELPQPAPSGPAVGETSPPAANADLLAAFLQGAAMTDAQIADPAAALREAGAAFRAFVHGIRQVLMARAEVKQAFRIDATIQSRRNNPIKFAAGDDDALAALLGAGRRTHLTASQAVEETLTDIGRHELAAMAAVQEALRALVAELDPARFRDAADRGLLPVQRRARAFELYEAAYAKTVESLSERMNNAFGRAFAVAYERVTNELRQGPRR